jgi:hypothetical protein
MADLVDSDCDTPEQHRLYAQHVIAAIDGKKWSRIIVSPEIFSWHNVAAEWVELMKLPMVNSDYGSAASQSNR